MSEHYAFHPSTVSDADLLERFQVAPDEESFRRLAERHLPMVWSTARRLANGDAALAEDISQVVLADFAKKAPGLPQGCVGAAWLHRHTCFTARKMVRTEIRRRLREHTAAQIQLDHAMTSENDPLWLDAAPHLDAALDQLGRGDREALLLRFWQGRDHRAIGSAMGLSEDTARKRVARAVEKLRGVMRRRGVILSTAILTGFLTDHAMATVPAALLARLPGAAWREANAAAPVVTGKVSWIRRFGWMASGTAALLCVVCYWAADGWTSDDDGKDKRGVPAAGTTAAAKTGNASEGGGATYNFTLVDAPAALFGTRLLTYEAGADDGKLLEEMRSIKGGGGGAGSVTEFSITAAFGQRRAFNQTTEHIYSDKWKWDETRQSAEPQNNETRSMGTVCEIQPGRSPEGASQLSWALNFQYAGPDTHAFPISLLDAAGKPGGVVQMDDFHSSVCNGQSGALREGERVLLMMQHIDSGALPGDAGEPRVILFFVNLTPL